ncbi:MAG: hypothetical protein AB1689_11450 [Thermodesulfobacteriota bacterium]
MREHRSTMVPNLLGAAYALCVLVGVPLRAWRRGRFREEVRAWPRSWGIVAAIVLLGVVHGTLLIYLFSVSGPFSYPALPFMAVLGLTGVAAVASRAARPLQRRLERAWPRWSALRPVAAGTLAVATCGLLLLFAATHARALQSWQLGETRLRSPARAGKAEQAGRWIGRHLPPNAVVMARHPWELRFFSPSTVKTVGMPWSDDPRETLGIAYYYGVTHVLPSATRPVLKRYLETRPPGIMRVPAPFPLYEIDWSAVRKGDVRLPHQTADARAKLLPVQTIDARARLLTAGR